MPRFRLPKTGRTDGFAREDERRAITGIATSTYYELMSRGEAPRQIRIGLRAVGWDRQELFEFNERRKAERDARWQSLGAAASKVIDKTKRASGEGR
jgi:predicted DNA-binding transcriptional regulator AlpA